MKETDTLSRFRSKKTSFQALRHNLACTLAGTASLAAFLAVAAPPVHAAHHAHHKHGHRLHLEIASQDRSLHHHRHHRRSGDETASAETTRHRHRHQDAEIASEPTHHHHHHARAEDAQGAHEPRLAELRARHDERMARLRHRHESSPETASAGHTARYAAHLRRLAEHDSHASARLAMLRARHEIRLAKIHEHQAAIIARDHALYSGNVVRAAEAFQGTRYVMGGTSRSGFDCSGFVRFILGHSAGVSLPRTALEQYYNGAPVERGSLQAGDLVFFKNTYRHGISHVGIYIGDDRFVHACNPRRGVTVDRLSEAYYINHYAGARRVMHSRLMGGEYDQDF